MDVIKHCSAQLRKTSLKFCYFVLRVEGTIPHIVTYVRNLQNIKYIDGFHFSYYGEVKSLLDSFLTYWTRVMDDAVRTADKCIHEINKPILLSIIENTLHVRYTNHEVFDKLFLPITTKEQQKIYDEMEEDFKKNIEGLYKMKATVEKFDKQEKVEQFAREEFPKSILLMNEVFYVAHTFISMMLADHLAEIKGSLQDLLTRHRSNLRSLEEESEKKLTSLLHKLYDKHKEQLMLSRRETRPSVEFVEVHQCPSTASTVHHGLLLSNSIDKIRQRVVENQNEDPIQRVKIEVAYYQNKMEEFNVIAGNLLKLKKELDEVKREEEVYNAIRKSGQVVPPGEKYECWKDMEVNFTKQKETLQEAMIRVAKSLLTFFSVRGPGRMTYNDIIGRYHIDEFGHQVYHYDYDLHLLHVDCERNYRQTRCKDFHYFDRHGRYVMKDGEKNYSLTSCTSSYRLGEDTALKKITKDCGHSDNVNKECGMKIKDLTDVAILPDAKPVDIKRTLQPEVVEYLWEQFGALLPQALYDVGVARPKNPIHYLAHRLLANKYGKTAAELKLMKQKAEEYRAKIVQGRKDEEVAEAQALKAKKPKRRKPEESFDSQEWAVYDHYAATSEFIKSLAAENFI